MCSAPKPTARGSGLAWRAHFHAVALRMVAKNTQEDEREERRRLQERTAAQREVLSEAFAEIAALIQPTEETGSRRLGAREDDQLLKACRAIGDQIGGRSSRHLGT